MPRGRTYDDNGRARALATLRANGGNAKKTARQLGIPHSTLRGWSGELEKGPGTHSYRSPAVPSAQAVREADSALVELLQTFSRNAQEKVNSALPEVPIETAADVRNMLVAQGIALEKTLLLTGQATMRTESLRITLIAPDSLRSGLKVIDVTPKGTTEEGEPA